MAGQLAWAHGTLMAFVGRRMLAGRTPQETSREALVLLDDIEEVLGEKVLKYAVRQG